MESEGRFFFAPKKLEIFFFMVESGKGKGMVKAEAEAGQQGLWNICSDFETTGYDVVDDDDDDDDNDDNVDDADNFPLPRVLNTVPSFSASRLWGQFYKISSLVV